MINPLMPWVFFAVFVLAMLWLDFRLFSGREKEVSIKEALLWSLFWMILALGFNVGVYFFSSHERALNFLTGYLIERALSMDNIFVFLLIFNFFRVPAVYQQVVLFWGILLALVLRCIFIALGVVIINAFHWSIYILGLFLVFVGIKMIFAGNKQEDLSTNPILRVIRKFFPVSDEYHGKKFFALKDGCRVATPLFVVFLMIAAMDIVFAVDSIPAILAITTDPFVVYTSNIFAIFGLRALFSAIS
ncbi:MAG: TerC/Alx family metal homeostasis membrane protein, partial [Candidatus Omnitrophica bacterium]|nr:TerC/Alx family metal homeostasis membrane protein [Candidatus Omnitrophota bacterium]